MAERPTVDETPAGYGTTEMGLLPEDWKVTRLGDLARIRGDTLEPAQYPDLRYVGLEHLRTGDPAIRSWGEASEVRSSKSAFYPGDLLYGKLRPYLDKAAVAEWAGMSSTDILVLIPGPDVDLAFLSYVVHSRAVLEHAIATTTGVNHPRTSWSAMSSLKLPLPPLPEQRAIAHVLSTVQRAREATEAVIAATRELKRSLMRHLFTYGPVPVDRVDGVRLKETEIGLVPEEWDVTSLGTVTRIERGKFAHRPRNDPAFYGGDVPFIQTGDVASCNGHIRTYSQTLNDKGLSVSRVFPTGTVVITIAANIGYSGILDFDSAFPDSLIAISPQELVDREYLNYYLITQRDSMDRQAPRGTQKNINIQFLAPWPTLVPSPLEQAAIVRTLKGVDARLAAQESRVHALDATFQILLRDLLTGRKRVEHQIVGRAVPQLKSTRPSRDQ